MEKEKALKPGGEGLWQFTCLIFLSTIFNEFFGVMASTSTPVIYLPTSSQFSLKSIRIDILVTKKNKGFIWITCE